MYIADCKKEDHAKVETFEICPSFCCAEYCGASEPKDLALTRKLKRIPRMREKISRILRILSNVLLFQDEIVVVPHE
jgi:hypothetical protein